MFQPVNGYDDGAIILTLRGRGLGKTIRQRRNTLRKYLPRETDAYSFSCTNRSAQFFKRGKGQEEQDYQEERERQREEKKQFLDW